MMMRVLFLAETYDITVRSLVEPNIEEASLMFVDPSIIFVVQFT